MQIIFTILVVAALSVVVVLLALTAGLDKAIILLPALLAVAITVHHEMLEDAAATQGA